MALERRGKSGKTGGPPPKLDGEGFADYYPDLFSFLSQDVWEDATSRTPGTLMIFAESGLWKAWLHDRDAGMGIFKSALTWEALMEQCQASVSGNDPDWRPDRKGDQGRQRK